MSKLLVGLDDSAVQTCANDMILAKEIADTLTQHYGGWAWAVHVDGKNGVASIRNVQLSGTWGYVLKLVNMYSASDFRKDVVRAGGEILERFGVIRGAFNEGKYLQLRCNFAGDPLFER